MRTLETLLVVKLAKLALYLSLWCVLVVVLLPWAVYVKDVKGYAKAAGKSLVWCFTNLAS